MKNVVLFCHIEKCAGTSITKKFTSELPFKAVDLLTKNNTVTKKEIKKTKLLYGRPRVISGHSINPTTFDDFRDVYQSIKTFTIFREPCSRLISNYLHDRTRGVWSGNLHDYMSIPWKQNYLLRFLGGGNPDNGYLGYEKIDFKISVKNINRSFPFLLDYLDLPISSLIERKNSFQQNKSDLPEDIRVKDGIKIGSYSISPDTYAKMTELNLLDIEFYQMALKQEEELIQSNELRSITQKIENTKANKTLQKVHWIYRNTLYKPFVIQKVGYHALPRNASPPNLVGPYDVF